MDETKMGILGDEVVKVNYQVQVGEPIGEVALPDGPVRLNIGAGAHEIEGFSPIDRSLGTEAYPLDYPDESVDEIRASHILEHFPHGTVQEVVNDWVRTLKPGGILRVAVPDFLKIAQSYLDGKPDNHQGYIMGGQGDVNDYHMAILDAENLREAFIRAGLEGIRPWESEIQDCASLPISLNLMGTKPTVADMQTSAVAVLSAPRYGPIVHSREAFMAFTKAGIPYQIGQGVFWEQVLSEMLEALLLDPQFEFIITCDYDTVFSEFQVKELIRMLRVHEDMDAICPVHCKRGDYKILFGIGEAGSDKPRSMYMAELEKSVVPITTGHFGLTVFRTESLRKLERPWFNSVPGDEGRWGKGRLDCDMYFWKNWKKCGLTLGLAPRVVVGHLEELVIWPDQQMGPIHQTLSDFGNYGIPRNAWR